MHAIFNSHERDIGDWQALLREADARYEFIGMNQPYGSILGIIETRWAA